MRRALFHKDSDMRFDELRGFGVWSRKYEIPTKVSSLIKKKKNHISLKMSRTFCHFIANGDIEDVTNRRESKFIFFSFFMSINVVPLKNLYTNTSVFHLIRYISYLIEKL